MNQKNLLAGLLVFVAVAFGGLIWYDVKYGHKFERILGKNSRPSENWKWADDWNNINPVNPNPNLQPSPNPPMTPLVTPQGPQLITGTYNEALQKSGELGKPVLVFFTADWCTWCKKMKQETMTDQKVQNVLKNYILVYVDMDKDRAPARQHSVESLPSYVITNYKEDNLKSESGFKSAESFASWLNNPNLYVQPKNERMVEPTLP
jgi:thiol-disulfide isomerase/thioredoxin